MNLASLSINDALLIAVCGFITVFLMLACLWLIIAVISRTLSNVQKMPASTAAAPVPVSAPTAAPAPVQLTNVDDLTAACIMAIVSDETGIPLSELIFKHIKAL